MDEEGYYTNLLNESEDNGATVLPSFNSTPATQQSLTVVGNSASTRPNQKTSKNFSEDEDKLLVATWLNVGIDPVRGTNQTRGAFWKRISDFFHSNKEISSDRSQSSLVHRWSTIQECVNKFCGCLAQIERRRQSGVTLQDKLMDACTLYKAEDKDNKSFQFMHCWNILKTQPKWHDKMNELSGQKSSHKKQKTAADSSPGLDSMVNGHRVNPEVVENSSPESDVGKKRPMGNKKAKENLRHGGGDACREALDHLWKKRRRQMQKRRPRKKRDTDNSLNLKKRSCRLNK